MASPAGNDFLTTLGINRLYKDILDYRTVPGELLFLGRTKQNPSLNTELIARWKGNVQIADLIAPNAPGVAYQAERIYAEAVNLQQMKVGTAWTADAMEEYYRIRESVKMDPDGVFAQGVFRRALMNHMLGNDWRKEWLLVARATDGFYGTSSYNRLGFSLTSPDGRTPTWGMKPDMKSFIPIPLGNPDGSPNVNCPIITYLFNMIEVRRRRYNRPTNRLTMNTATKRAIQQTTEFKNAAIFQQAPFTTFNNIVPSNYLLLDQLLNAVLAGSTNGGRDLEVVTYDAVYQTENGDGLPAQYVPFLPTAPEACILMDDTRNDRNNSMHDMGIGTTMESRAESLRFNGGGIPDDLPAGRTGAFSWLDMPTDMNPVRFAMWTTERAWPRKFDEVCESVLFVGPIADPIALTDIVIV